MKRLKKILKIIMIILIVIITLFTISIGSIFLIKIYMEKNSVQKKYYDRGIEIIPKADYILVPGAQINSEGPNRHLAHRLQYANKLYVEQKASKIIVSGGYDTKVKKHESDIMYQYLCELGVKEEDIIIDLKRLKYV